MLPITQQFSSSLKTGEKINYADILNLKALKTVSNMTNSTGADSSDDVKEEKLFGNLIADVPKDEKSYMSPTEVSTTVKILEKAKAA